jgi:hypothetical protein
MKSIILDLQNETVSSNQTVSDLLRKSYIIARKLKIVDFERWIHNELNGYRDKSDIPDYRIMTGELRGWNSFHGWIPVIIPDMEIQKILTQYKNFQGIPDLENLIGMEEVKGGIYVPLPDAYSEFTGHDTKYKLQLNIVQINTVIQTVKNIILEWLLKLEEDGIMGENLTFSNEEKDKAVKNNYTVNYFYGDITSSQIQQHTINSSQDLSFDFEKVKEITNLLKKNIKNISKEGDDEELSHAILAMETELKKDKPKMNIIQELLKIIRTILEGVAGNIIAAGILYKMNQI